MSTTKKTVYKRVQRLDPLTSTVLKDYATEHCLTSEQVRSAEHELKHRQANKNVVSMTAAELYPPRVKNRSKRGWTTPIKKG
jgi:hypothetical protein